MAHRLTHHKTPRLAPAARFGLRETMVVIVDSNSILRPERQCIAIRGRWPLAAWSNGDRMLRLGQIGSIAVIRLCSKLQSGE